VDASWSKQAGVPPLGKKTFAASRACEILHPDACYQEEDHPNDRESLCCAAKNSGG
jgi:hypothetical protein